MSIKQMLLFPFRMVDGLLDRIAVVIGALLFAQVPQLIAQYMQRLGGHVDELTRIVGKYTAAAAELGKTLEQFIATHVSSNVADFASTGRIMEENVMRLKELSQGLAELNAASVYTKLYIFFKNLDTDIFKNTFHNFIPGVPVTAEAVVYAIIGLLVGMLAYHAVRRGIIALTKKVGPKGPTSK